MNALELIKDGRELYADSRDIAEMIEKDHSKLLRTIRTYVDYLNEANIGSVDFFEEAEYEDSKGETRPCYFITKKGCDMIANKLTGKKGVLFTAAYVTAFEEMRDRLNAQSVIELLPVSDVKHKNKIEGLPDKIRKNVDKCLIAGWSMARVSIMIASCAGVYISPSAVGRYCRKYFETDCGEQMKM